MGRTKLWAVVHFGLELDSMGRVLVFKPPGGFPSTPCLQALVHIQAFFGHLCWGAGLNGQLHANTIGVKEINAFKDMVVGHAEHLNAVGLQSLFGVF